MAELGSMAKSSFTKYSRVLLRSLRSPTLGFFILTGNLILAASVTTFYQAEVGINPQVHTVGDALWWGMTTVSTVGYGDIVPLTHTGRLVGMILMILGGSFFAGVTAIFVTSFVAVETQESERDIGRISKRLEMLDQKLSHVIEKLNESTKGKG